MRLACWAAVVQIGLEEPGWAKNSASGGDSESYSSPSLYNTKLLFSHPNWNFVRHYTEARYKYPPFQIILVQVTNLRDRKWCFSVDPTPLGKYPLSNFKVAPGDMDVWFRARWVATLRCLWTAMGIFLREALETTTYSSNVENTKNVHVPEKIKDRLVYIFDWKVLAVTYPSKRLEPVTEEKQIFWFDLQISSHAKQA